MPTNPSFASKLIAFSDQLTSSERYHFHLMMSVGLGGLAPAGDIPSDGVSRAAWGAAVEVVTHLNPFGCFRLGQPSFVIREYLAGLRDEASAARAYSERYASHELSGRASLARRLAADDRFAQSIEAAVGQRVEPTDSVNYHYYEAGDSLAPHVDPVGTSAINCVIGIDHQVPPGASSDSALVVYRPDGVVERIRLAMGEIVILFAPGTIHGRELLGPGERLITLTIGLRPRAGG